MSNSVLSLPLLEGRCPWGACVMLAPPSCRPQCSSLSISSFAFSCFTFLQSTHFITFYVFVTFKILELASTSVYGPHLCVYVCVTLFVSFRA